MSRRVVRAALTETCNTYAAMPETVAELGSLKDQLEDIRKANVQHHIELMEVARKHGVQVICFGELFPAPYFALGTDPIMDSHGRRRPTWQHRHRTARSGPPPAGMIVIAPIYEKDGENRYNTAVVIDEEGEILGKFRKAHIPFGGNGTRIVH